MKTKICIESVETIKGSRSRIYADFPDADIFDKFASEFHLPHMDVPSGIIITGDIPAGRIDEDTVRVIDFSGSKVKSINSGAFCANVDFSGSINFV